MNAGYWLERADRSLRSAALVADAGDFDRAASTAYYAMFYAARVALIHVGRSERAMGKTHSGMASAVSEFLVKSGHMAIDHQRAFAFELNRRLTADYEEGGVTVEGATDAIANATAFVEAVRKMIAGSSSE